MGNHDLSHSALWAIWTCPEGDVHCKYLGSVTWLEVIRMFGHRVKGSNN